MLSALLAKVKGYKTYAVVGSMVLYAVFFLGVYAGDWASAQKTLLEAAAIAGLRDALGK